MSGIKGLRKKISLYLVISFGVVVVLFTLFFIPFYNGLYDTRLTEIKSKLNIIVDSRIESVGNQLYLRNYTALEVFVRDWRRYTGVAGAAIYSGRGSLIGGPQESSELQLLDEIMIEAQQKRYFYVDSIRQHAVLVAKVNAFGETAGYISISYDLQAVNGDMLNVALFMCTLILVLFVVVNAGMQIYLWRLISIPLAELAHKLNVSSTNGDFDVEDVMYAIENLIYTSKGSSDK